MPSDVDNYPIKTTKVNGQERKYYAVRFAPGWAIVHTYLGFHEGIDVKPPPFKHRPSYPAVVEPGKGVAVVDSPYVKVYPVFFLDAVILIAIIVISLITNTPALLLLLLPAIPILALTTWLAYIFWLTTAMVVKESSATFFKGFYAVNNESVQGADFKGVKLGPLGNRWMTRALATKFDVWYLRAQFGDTEVSESSRNDVDPEKKSRSLNRFVLRGIGNGPDVGRLINRLQTSWEDSLRESQKQEKKSADFLASIDKKLNPELLNKFSRAYVAVSNRDARLMREMIDLHKEMLPLLQSIAKGLVPGDRTAPIPIIPKKPDSAPQGNDSSSSLDKPS
ncbi:MAG: hypothetical protein NVSMB39_6890 [Candidatus Saccharimonadales bacterium]